MVEEVGDGKFSDKGLVQKRPVGWQWGRWRIPRMKASLQLQPVVFQIPTLGGIFRVLS
jgi:hypothetical protein